MATDKKSNRKPAHEVVNAEARARRAAKTERKKAGQYNSLWYKEREQRLAQENAKSQTASHTVTSFFGTKLPKREERPKREASFVYPLGLCSLVRNSGLSFYEITDNHNHVLYERTHKDVNLPLLVSAQKVADTMVAYMDYNSKEPLDARGKFKVAYSMECQERARLIAMGYRNPELNVLESKVFIPQDELKAQNEGIPHFIICAYGWGVERILDDHAGVFIQDRNGKSTFLRNNSWNLVLNFQTIDQRSQVLDELKQHDEVFCDPSRPYEYSNLDRLTVVTSENGKLHFKKVCPYQVVDVRAIDKDIVNLGEDVPSVNFDFGPDFKVCGPYAAYFRRNVNGRLVHRVYLYAPGYRVESWDESRGTYIVKDCDDRIYYMKPMTCPRVFSYRNITEWEQARGQRNL